MRNSLFIFMIWFGATMAPNHLSAQEFRHRISVQTGLFHYFFEDSPILNVNYPTHYKVNVFNGLFLSSFGINYTFCINEKSNISVELSSFNEQYSKFKNTFEDHPVILERRFKTYGLNYTRELELSKHFSFLYGAGIHYRRGDEAVILNRFLMAPGIYEIAVGIVQRKDIGLNAFTGINYNFSRRFYCFSKVDFLGFVYMGDKKQKKVFAEEHGAPQFPTRFDLSLKFGVGVKF